MAACFIVSVGFYFASNSLTVLLVLLLLLFTFLSFLLSKNGHESLLCPVVHGVVFVDLRDVPEMSSFHARDGEGDQLWKWSSRGLDQCAYKTGGVLTGPGVEIRVLIVLYLSCYLDGENVENERVNYASISQSDYGKHQVPFPVHAKRQASEKLVFGQESPTYQSTSSEAYQDHHLTATLHHHVPDDVNQLVDHVVLGSSSPNDMLSVNHHDFINHNLSNVQGRRKNVNYLNDSGFVFGEDDSGYITSNQEQFAGTTNPPNVATKVPRADLFRSSSGLLFGQASARYLSTNHADYLGKQNVKGVDQFGGKAAHSTKDHVLRSSGLLVGSERASARWETSHKDFPGYETYVDDNNAQARLNKQHFQASEKFLLGQDTSTSPKVIKDRGQLDSQQQRGTELWTRKKINLFEASDDWRMGYKYAQSDPESARYSSKNKQGQQERPGGSVLGEKEKEHGTHGHTDDAEDNWDIYAGKSKSRSSKRRHGRRKRGRRMNSLVVDGEVDVEEEASQRYSQHDTRSRRSLAELQEEVRTMGSATLESNGLLWFPVADQNSFPKGLPKWAESAMKYSSGSDIDKRLEGNRSSNNKGTVMEENTNEQQSAVKSTQELEDQAQKVSIPSSSLDEGLVLESRSLHSQHQKRPDMPDYQDSINDSQRSSAGLDSLDSLERARNSAGREAGTQQGQKAGAVDDKTVVLDQHSGSILERTRDKLRIPKLVPVGMQAETPKADETQTGETAGKQITVEKKDTQNEKADVGQEDKVELTDNGEGDKASVTSSADIKTENLEEQRQHLKNSSPKLNKEQEVQVKRQDSKSRASLEGTADGKKRQGSLSSVDKVALAVTAITTAAGVSSSDKRKGRRQLGNLNSQRNQLPNSTLNGVFQQGYRERTTESQDAFPAPQQVPTPKPRFQKKVPIGEDGYAVVTTSRPLQHSPKNKEQIQSSKERTVQVTAKPDSERAAEKNSAKKKTSSARSDSQNLPAILDRNSSRRKPAKEAFSLNDGSNWKDSGRGSAKLSDSALHHMPVGWQRTQGYKFADTLRFDTSQRFDGQSSNQQDYGPWSSQGIAARPHSLDRKLLRSQMGELMAQADTAGSDLADRRRRHRSTGPAIGSDFSSYRRPDKIVHADHQLFEGDGRFYDQSETTDAFRTREAGQRRRPYKPRNQLEPMDKLRDDLLPGQSVTQEAYHRLLMSESDRSRPFKPASTLNLFNGKVSPGRWERGVSIGTRASRLDDRPRSAEWYGQRAGVASSDAHVSRKRQFAAGAERETLPPVRGASARTSGRDSGAPFSDITTNHDAYRDPGLADRPNLFRQNSSGAFQPDGSAKLASTTTSHDAFRKFSSAPHAEPVLPHDNHLFATTSPLSNKTTSHEAYRDFGYTRPSRSYSQPPRHYSSILQVGPGDAAEQTTTSMQAYKNFATSLGGNELKKASQVVRVNPVTGEVKMFQAVPDSQNHVSYVPVRADICPASLIESGQHAFSFAGKEQGHLYYNLDSA